MADNRQAGSLWTPEEDVLLLRHVAKYGTKHWGYLQTAGILPHRDQKACCNRFILLKRKFFQARAKGQRLTFPVVPQPELPAVKKSSSPSPSSGRHTSPPRTLQVIPCVGFKKSGCSPNPMVSSVRKALLMNGGDLTQSMPSEVDSLSASYNAEQADILRRTMENLPEKPCARQDSVVSSSQAPLMMPDLLPKEEKVELPVTQPKEKQLVNKGGSLNSSSLTGLFNSNTTQTAAWACFGADDLSTLLAEVTDQTFPPTPDVTQPAVSSLAPDALLEQMASTPMRTLFGGNPNMTSAAENLLEAYTCVESFPRAQSSNLGFDLWDLMRASASV